MAPLEGHIIFFKITGRRHCIVLEENTVHHYAINSMQKLDVILLKDSCALLGAARRGCILYQRVPGKHEEAEKSAT